MNHSFNIHYAEKYGILEAVLLENIVFWIRKNQANNHNFNDGKTWVYNSITAWSELFPYASDSQIRRALDKLVNDDVLIKGNYNKLRVDRTLWYTLHDCHLHLANTSNGLMNTSNGLANTSNAIESGGKPLPVINTDINTNINTDKKKAFDFPFNDSIVSYWEKWKEYKKVEHGFKFKSIVSEETSLKDLHKKSGGKEALAIELIDTAIANGWKGFFLKKEFKKKSNNPNARYEVDPNIQNDPNRMKWPEPEINNDPDRMKWPEY